MFLARRNTFAVLGSSISLASLAEALCHSDVGRWLREGVSAQQTLYKGDIAVSMANAETLVLCID